jgi:hypothetical protein
MLLKQLETLGVVHVPTCLVGLGLVRHSLVPDLLGPALAHHGLELGLAFLRASLDHLRIGHLGLVLGINWRLQLGICRGLYQRVFPHHQGFQCLGGRYHPLPCQFWIKFKIHYAKLSTELKTIYLVATADRFLNSPRSSFQPNRTNRINKRMTALLNAKSTLSSAIDTVTKPYANATATTQETVSQVSSLNLSSIDDNGKLLVSSCSGGF